MMPEFFSKMPGPAAGAYRASVRRFWSFGPGRELWACVINGRRRAYLNVRLYALLFDVLNLGNECGIEWAIEELKS